MNQKNAFYNPHAYVLESSLEWTSNSANRVNRETKSFFLSMRRGAGVHTCEKQSLQWTCYMKHTGTFLDNNHSQGDMSRYDYQDSTAMNRTHVHAVMYVHGHTCIHTHISCTSSKGNMWPHSHQPGHKTYTYMYIYTFKCVCISIFIHQIP